MPLPATRQGRLADAPRFLAGGREEGGVAPIGGYAPVVPSPLPSPAREEGAALA